MRSLADNDPMAAARSIRIDPKAIKISPWRALLLAVGLLWLLITIWLVGYYWDNSGWGAETSQDRMVGGHHQMDRSEAAVYGLGSALMSPTNGTDPAIGRLMELRGTLKTGTEAERAVAIQQAREQVLASNNEAYRMIWTPVLTCAASECDNEAYIRAAADLAARTPRWAGHAMIVEAAYWHYARAGADTNGQAAAVARLDRLVRAYAGNETRKRWEALQSCGGTCPVFDELLLDFMSEAAKD